MRHVIYKIFKQHNLVLKMWSGKIGNEELFAFERAPFLDPEFPSRVPNGICDITTASFGALSPEDFATISAIYQEHGKKTEGSKIAIIAGDEFEKARQFEAVMSGVGISVIAFNDLATACKWLGVPLRETAEWFVYARAELAREKQ